MTRSSGAAALPHVLGLAALLALCACPARPKPERRGPFLIIAPRETTPVGSHAAPPGSIALALGGLPPEEMVHLRERLEASADAAVRRAAPTLFDLDVVNWDAAAPDPLRQVLPDLPPLTAAANVLGAPWSAPGLSVELGPTCEATATTRCVPLFAPVLDEGGDALVRRGCALAWTLAYAARLRVPQAARAGLLRSLRGAESQPSTSIALVFGASRGTLDEVELGRVREQARRSADSLPAQAPLRPWLEALAAAPATWELPVALDADQVLVIPRLSALARLQDFRAEVERAGAQL